MSQIKSKSFWLSELFDYHPDFGDMISSITNKEVKHQFSTIYYDHKMMNVSKSESKVCKFYYEGEKLVGGVYYYLPKKKSSHVSLYAVFSLKRGVGTKIIEEIHKTLFLQDYSFIRFFANHQAMNFYLKFGYKFFGYSKSEQLPLVYAPLLDEDVYTSNKLFYESETLTDVLTETELDKLENVYVKSFQYKNQPYKKKLKEYKELYENNIFYINFDDYRNTIDDFFQ